MNFAKTLLMLASLTLVTACAKSTQPSPTVKEHSIAVKTQTVKLLPVEDEIAVSGLLVSEKEARLSFKTGGMVQKIWVCEGDSVQEGQLLAALNLTEINAQAEQAKEALSKAERDFKRASELFTASVATQEQFDNAKTALALAQHGWEIANYNKSFSEIRAPQNGVVLRRLMNEGEMAAGGSPVFFFSGSGSQDWTLQCGVSDKNWAKLQKGDKAELGFDAFSDKVFTGRVIRLSQGADPATGLYQADIQVDPQSERFAAGLFGQGKILLKSSQWGVKVPSDALVEGQGNKAKVYLAENGRAQPREVTVLQLKADHAVVTGELHNGSSLIVEGAAWVAAGTLVKTVQ